MKNTEKGFSLIELLLVVVVFSFAAALLMSFMSSRSRSIDLLNVNKAASDSLENGLKAITRTLYKDLPDGSSFTVIDQGTVQLEPCSNQTCDYVIDDSGSSGDTPIEPSMAGGAIWENGIPTSAQMLFFRRWRIEEIDPALRLKRITVAVFLDDQSFNPLVMTTTVVGEK